MSKPANFGGFTLYRIYCGDCIVYLGRTMQPLKTEYVPLRRPEVDLCSAQMKIRFEKEMEKL